MGSNTQFNGYVRSRYWYQTAKTNCATTPAPSPLSLHDEMQKVPSSATASPTGNPTAGTDAPALAGLIGITHDRVEVSHSAAQGWLIVQVGSSVDASHKSVGEAANDLEKIPAEQLAGRPAFSGFPLNSPAERIDASVLAASNSASQQQPGIRRLVGWRAGRHRRRL